jgi:uncharacterized protein (DUF362 family)
MNGSRQSQNQGSWAHPGSQTSPFHYGTAAAEAVAVDLIGVRLLKVDSASLGTPLHDYSGEVVEKRKAVCEQTWL